MVGPRPKTAFTDIDLYHLHAAFTATGLDQSSGERPSTGIAIIKPSISCARPSRRSANQRMSSGVSSRAHATSEALRARRTRGTRSAERCHNPVVRSSWQSVVEDLRARIPAGLDLAQPFQVAWYNRAVADACRLSDFGRSPALGILVGNTRAIWSRFLDAWRENRPGLDERHRSAPRAAEPPAPIARAAEVPGGDRHVRSDTGRSHRDRAALAALASQHPPLGPGLVEVEDSVDHIALLCTAVVLALKVVFDEATLFVGEVAVVHGS